jgi:LmbE family N-acetylglucosaminyl deacetylase
MAMNRKNFFTCGKTERRLLIISPHFDDGVLSAGGTIAQLARSGTAVTVATVFSAASDGLLSAAAEAFHERCGLGVDAMSHRAAEDREACHRLGAEPVHLGLREALYRRRKDGNPQYDEGSAIFGADADAELTVIEQAAALIGALVDGLDPELVLAPLGVGAHIDHVIAGSAMRRIDMPGDRVCWFEDIPYALYRHLKGWEQHLTADLLPLPVAIDERAWQSKIAAITSYQSQLSVLWYEEAPWQRQLRDYAVALGADGPVERLWVTA